jgi:hypothetical protein
MKTITKVYKSLKQAESYQNRLYGKYNYVRLISSPLFSEEGKYVWQVKN